MSTTTNQLATHIQESQGQKEVTANEAFDKLDRIIGVYEVTATSGTATLTAPQSENGLIRATGALSGNLTITIDGDYINGWRIISNETSNAHSLFVEFDGGAAAEEVTQGEAALFIDGVLIQMGGGGGAADGGVLEVEYPYHVTEGMQPSSNFATFDTRNDRWVADFDATTDESLLFDVQIPYAWTGGNIEVDVYFYATSATSGNGVWQGAWERGNTDVDSDSFAAAQSSGQVAVNGTSGILSKGTITFTSAQIDGTVAGEPAVIKINRDADNTSATDDAAGDLELLKIVVRYPVDQ